MKQILKTSVASLVGLGLALSVLAQTPTPTPSPSPTRTPLSEQRKDIRDTRTEGMGEIKEIRKLTREEMENLRREYQTKIREAQTALKAKLEAKRAQLKSDLSKIKDERKKQVTERVDKNLDALNERLTNNFVDALDKLDAILVRIDERTDRAEASRSLDVSSVRTVIIDAQAKILEARAAIQVQAGKTYPITVTSDAGLKDAVKKARQALHDDLKAVQDKVKMARDAVHEAARAYAKAHGRDLPSPSVSPSPSPTPTATVSPTATP